MNWLKVFLINVVSDALFILARFYLYTLLIQTLMIYIFILCI